MSAPDFLMDVEREELDALIAKGGEQAIEGRVIKAMLTTFRQLVDQAAGQAGAPFACGLANAIGHIIVEASINATNGGPDTRKATQRLLALVARDVNFRFRGIASGEHEITVKDSDFDFRSLLGKEAGK